ncbi:MAG: class I SAM-dependent methyltransferase [Bacteroidota bacterium]
MNHPFTEEEIRELEKQLSCPNGEFGIEIGETMNETNIRMTLNSIDFLTLKNDNVVLELGHGNCGHLQELLGAAKRLNYHGLEISETMYEEAQKINADKPAEFNRYDGNTIPYANHFFDRTFSVNTIYFWENPEQLIGEIERTLKPEGCCVLTFGNKEFMENLPFVRGRFTLYDRRRIKRLIGKSNLTIEETREVTEQVKSKTGDQVERKFTMVKLKK